MHARSIVAGAIVVAAASVVASPPACLLAAINTQPNPADVKTICATNSDAVQNAIYASCTTSNQAAAVSSFADTCQSAGVKITMISPPSSATAKATGMTSGPAPPDPSTPLYKPTMYQQPPTRAPANVQSNSTSSVQASPADLLNSGLTSGSGNGTSSGNGPSSTSGSGKKSGASRVSAVTGVLGLSVAGFVGVLALL